MSASPTKVREGRRRWLGTAAVVIALLARPHRVRARVQADFTYPWTQVWQATVRLVRVDLDCPVTDRDPDVGYVMFNYRDAGRDHGGSVELVRSLGPDGVERVRVIVQVQSMPSWVERMVLDRLTRKLHDDYGEPPHVPRPPRQERGRPPGDPTPPEPPGGSSSLGPGEPGAPARSRGDD